MTHIENSDVWITSPRLPQSTQPVDSWNYNPEKEPLYFSESLFQLTMVTTKLPVYLLLLAVWEEQSRKPRMAL